MTSYFNALTYRIIRDNFPKAFHRTSEWEYEVDDSGNKDTPLKLEVWRDSQRKHGRSFTLSAEDSKKVRVAISRMINSSDTLNVMS